MICISEWEIHMIRDLVARSSLLARFSLVSIIVTSLIAAGLASWLAARLERDALWAIAESAEAQATGILSAALHPEDLAAPPTGARYAEIDAVIRNTLGSSGIVRVKLFNGQGLVVYSDDEAIVGTSFPLTNELATALEGRMTTETAFLGEAEDASELGISSRLFEVYIPFHPQGDANLLGVAEVYYDMAELQPRLERIRVAVWTGVGLGFLALYAALFLVVRNASRELIARNEENRRLLSAETKQRKLADTLARVSMALSQILDLRELLDLICQESVQVFGAHAAFLWLVEREELVGFAAYGRGAEQFIGRRFPLYDPDLLGARVVRERRPLLVNDAPHSRQVSQDLIREFSVQSILGAPLRKGERILGALMILDTDDPQRFRPADLEAASVFGSQAATAIENAQLFEQARRALGHERALREIDHAITSGPSLDDTLRVVLKQARKQLEVDAGAILLLNSKGPRLLFGIGDGFKTSLIERSDISLGEGLVGGAAQEGRICGRPDLAKAAEIPERLELFKAEGFAAYFAAPLLVKEKALGLLEVFHRTPLRPTTDWLTFFETLSSQAAIAMDNATLLAQLQESNRDLLSAYEATIEGWSAALDLRDRETEGHTRRVTEMTVRLAEIMGMSPQDVAQVRRGALLHDIGKMGVPDRILLKRDGLTEEEWLLMRKHPSYAHDMLQSITYLRAAMDIPHFHHERWDGSGYPDGLAGEAIPLAARIFAVVDVFDALSSDRPYREKWSREKVVAHIQSMAGTHFDRNVVDAFLKMISTAK